MILIFMSRQGKLNTLGPSGVRERVAGDFGVRLSSKEVAALVQHFSPEGNKVSSRLWLSPDRLLA
jgi:hypothetical protein